MKFKLEIVMGNDAVLTTRDLVALLRIVTQSVSEGGKRPSAFDEGKVRDENGNTVGKWSFIPEGEAETPADVTRPRQLEIARAWLDGAINFAEATELAQLVVASEALHR
jgi:hypothetical protein